MLRVVPIVRSARQSSWRVRWYKFVLNWGTTTTDQIGKGPSKLGILAGLGSAGALLWYGLYGMEVGALKKKSFHELYPDPRLQPMHQDIAIPNIMVDITRESYCKPEWAVFQECLDSHTLVERTKGQAIQKTVDLLMGSCDEVREALHQCQVRAYDDRDLYFQAKERFLARQDQYLLSQMPTDQQEEIELAIKAEIPIYSILDETQKAYVVQLVKKHGKERVYLDSKGEFIDLRDVIIDQAEGSEGGVKKVVFDHGQQLFNRLADLEDIAIERGMEIDKKASLKPLENINVKGLK